MDFTGRPAQLILMASVARRYYLEGKSKTEIAEELGLSRFKVARLLVRADVAASEAVSRSADRDAS
jgi:DNA-binding transcriptional regulator LsrR (DeoR family)